MTIDASPMKKLWITAVSWAAVVGAVVLFVWLLTDSGSPAEGEGRQLVSLDSDGADGVASRKEWRKSVRRKFSREDIKRRLEKELDFDQDEEAKLTAEQKALLDEIRRILDAGDSEAMIRLVQKMQMSDEWPDGIPVALRKAAIEALSWFGHDCVPEILGFVQDSDPEVLQASVDAYEQALFEANGDREISQLVIAAAKTINDFDSIDSLLMWLNDMRPSVIVQTIKAIWEHGTEEAKRALNENMEFITGEEGIDTPEELDAWYNDPSGDHKDDEDAEDFYGAQKD